LLYQKALAEGLMEHPKIKSQLISVFLEENVYSDSKSDNISDEELKAYYEAHKEEFYVSPKVQVYNILVKITDDMSDADAKAKADRLYQQLRKDPSKFRDIAKDESDSPYKRRGGDLGFIPESGKPGLDSELVEKAFSMNVETLSEPFKAPSGWNIIYIAAKREGKQRSFEDMRGAVLRKLRNSNSKESYDTYMAQLKNGQDIKIDEAKLQAVEVEVPTKPSLTMPNGMQLGQPQR